MIPSSRHYSGQRIAVPGIGRSGAAAARLARHLGADVALFDDGDPAKTAGAAEALRGDGFTVHTGTAALEDHGVFDLAVLSPGIDPSWPIARAFSDNGVPCVSELEFAWRHAACPAIAITGTNGKTTTTGLIAHLLKSAGVRTEACGNYGTPLSEIILRGEVLDAYTLELSSFQLELIDTFRARVAVWLNFAPDHLDRHPSLDAYRAAKLRIFENQLPSDTAVINGDETELAQTLTARRVTFSAWREESDWTYADGAVLRRGVPLVRLADTKLRGRHNAENIMAALAAAEAWGLDPAEVAGAVATFTPHRHRCEIAAVIDGREFLNDSKATNIHAMESALRGQDRPVVLIAGGKDKGLDYAPVTDLIREKATHVFTIGEIGPALARVWESAAPCRACAGLEEAVRLAAAAAAPGQTVLFAPGTSSFDMFTGYDHRGNVFCDIVTSLHTP